MADYIIKIRLEHNSNVLWNCVWDFMELQNFYGFVYGAQFQCFMELYMRFYGATEFFGIVSCITLWNINQPVRHENSTCAQLKMAGVEVCDYVRHQQTILSCCCLVFFTQIKLNIIFAEFLVRCVDVCYSIIYMS